MKLTESWLRSQSTPGSFERGQRYYQKGHVIRVLAFEGFYRGEVQGSELYHQTLDLREAYPALSCTCPYSSGGYCKHLIAVGLSILEGKYEAPTELEISRNDRQEVPDWEVVEHWWEEMPESYRLQFLKEALQKFPAWRKPFVDYMDVRHVPSVHIELDRLREAMDANIKALPIQSVDLPSDPIESIDEEMDTWEMDEVERTQLVESALKEGIRHVNTFQREADWPNSLVALLAIYETVIHIQKALPAHTISYGEALETAFQEQYHKVVDRISESLLSPSIRRWMVQHIFDRYLFYVQAAPAHAKETHPQYQLEDWTLLLQLLTATPALAQFLARKLEAHNVQGEGIERLQAFLKRIIEPTPNGKG